MIDISIIGRYLNSESLGYYTIALTISGIVTSQISTTFSIVALPIYSKVQENKNKLREAYLKTLKSVSMIIFPAACGIISIAYFLIKVLYGDKWLPAVVALQVLCIYGLTGSIIDITKNLYLAIGQPKIMSKIYFLQFFFILVLIGPLTTEYGIIGTSVAVTVASTISMFLSLNEAGKLIGSSSLDIINSMLPSSLGSVIIILLVFVFQRTFDYLQPYLILFLSITLGISSYYLFFKLIYKEEIEEIKWLINAKVRS
jgi:O-antigen/teichoic acid export membrane protein